MDTQNELSGDSGGLGKKRMPKLIYRKGDINFDDGRCLVEFDAGQDREDELKAIVLAVNAHDALVEALKGWQALVSESRGLDNYHKNGDVAEWNEFYLVRQTEEILARLEEGSK